MTMAIMDFIGFAIAAVIGLALGYALNRYVINAKANLAADEAERELSEARKQAETLKKEALLEAKDQIIKQRQEANKEEKERRKEITAIENRLGHREESVDRRAEALDKREHQISSAAGQIAAREREVEAAVTKQTEELARVARMTQEEAKTELLDKVAEDCKRDAAAIIRDTEEQAKKEADKRARSVVSLAIQRIAADHTAETTVSVVHLPNDDMKGRLIGREGRNIRAFEQITGINLIVDDTPEAVVISSFDPVRREIGRMTLESLIQDGRIHPARIEEMFAKSEKTVNELVNQAGEQASYDSGVHNLHPEILKTLGRLKYRSSYGQNVLKHSLEVSWLAGVMANELGADVTLAERAGLLHDLGKAIDHEIEGTHASIGADLARRLGEPPAVVHAIEAHHGDVECQSVEAVLVMAADAISAARPGARRETLESYIKRLEKLEAVANAHPGVEKTYAMQAGREIRVMVQPETVDDDEAVVLARDIASQIEAEMEYPGQVRIMVVRESRAIDYAK
ncbi:MAG: ribonuclease Y [Coriobacteriia bacterium]|nr:ribonuclease Y [Coriobacteriia bacterium]